MAEQNSAHMPSTKQLHVYLAFAEGLAKDAGGIARKFFAGDRPSTRKKDFSLLTEADTRINDLVIERVLAAYPDHDILGEEASRMTGKEFVWVCDPIDGTAPFVDGLPYSCFELALVISGTPVVAVIYDFNNDRMYTAEKGGGAHRNGTPIEVSGLRDITKATVATTSGDHDNVDVIALRSALEAATYDLYRLRSNSQESALVACGQIDGGIFIGSAAHDVAAPKLIIEEAGGRCTNLFGEDQRYDKPVNGLVYSNGKIHEDLLMLVQHSLL